MVGGFLNRIVPRNLLPQRIHTELMLRGIWEANAKGSIDEMFSSSGMDELSVKSCFDVLDQKFGRELKSNDKTVLDVTIPLALYALSGVIQHHADLTNCGTWPYQPPPKSR